jgi:type III pantothenate kinase
MTGSLLLDIGNSRLKAAVLHDGVLHEAGESPTAQLATDLPVLFRGLPRPDQVHVANVAGAEAARVVSDACDRHWSLTPKFAAVRQRCAGLVTDYADPGQLGVDRWLAVLAAWQERRPACVASCGTAITVDVLQPDGHHAGGYILPGIELMQTLLNRHTDGIAVQDAASPAAQPGITTAGCVANGAALAAAALIGCVFDELRQRCGAGTRCILTGGAASAVRALLRNESELDPLLVLRGLAIAAAAQES